MCVFVGERERINVRAARTVPPGTRETISKKKGMANPNQASARGPYSDHSLLSKRPNNEGVMRRNTRYRGREKRFLKRTANSNQASARGPSSDHSLLSKRPNNEGVMRRNTRYRRREKRFLKKDGELQSGFGERTEQRSFVVVQTA